MKTEQLGVLATVVIAFAALATLVLTGQAGLRQDLRTLQAETLAGQTALRAGMQTGQAALREEIRAGQAALRAEMQTGQTALRAGMQTGQAALREEMLTGQAALRAEMLAGQAELRAGQVLIRKDLAALGSRLAVVEHRTDALEARLVVEQRTVWPDADIPAAAPDPTSPAGPPPQAIPSH